MSRFTSAVSAVALASALCLAGAAPARSAGPAFAALGDSYASGLGAGAYDSASGDCRRSPNAYPALWATAHHAASFTFAACAGASTTDVVNKQLHGLGPATSLVSITAGGNDAGFADVMSTCVLHSQDSCLQRVAQARTYVDKTLPGRLDAAYAAIRAKAPRARVVVVGYPRFYKVPGDCLLGIGDTSRKAIDSAADDLDGVIAKRAADHGFAYADVRRAFTGHELCSGSPWLHSLSLPLEESYHPTATGQRGGFLPPFAAAA
jgi:hypothetical protein